MPWMETAPVEQRERFIADHRAGHLTMTELCRLYGISRKTGYKWLRRHAEEGRSSVLGELLLHVAQAEAAAVDLQHMAVVQQTVQDGRGQDLVAGQHLRPFADALVGGDQGTPGPVA